MALSMEDLMASDCPYFVRAISVRRRPILTEKGAGYYLLDTTGEKIKIGESIRPITRNLIYVADTTFIKKYSALFNLGQKFQWKRKADFTAWAADILAARPKFIEPHLRSANALVVPRSIDAGVAYQPSWFQHAVIQIKNDMEVKIPKEFCPYILAPPVAVAIVHSGNKSWYVKIEDYKLTEGWYDIVCAHTLSRGSNLLFAYVGHLEFDLFIFYEQGCERNYVWSTTLPIEHVNAPIGWDSEAAMCSTNGSAPLTACLPSSFRATRHALRCALLLTAGDLEKLYTPERFQNFCNMHGHHQLTLVMKRKEWTVSCVNGYLTGVGWKDFVRVHKLRPFDVLVISPDINFVLHAMVIGVNDCESTYPWYFDDYEDILN